MTPGVLGVLAREHNHARGGEERARPAKTSSGPRGTPEDLAWLSSLSSNG